LSLTSRKERGSRLISWCCAGKKKRVSRSHTQRKSKRGGRSPFRGQEGKTTLNLAGEREEEGVRCLRGKGKKRGNGSCVLAAQGSLSLCRKKRKEQKRGARRGRKESRASRRSPRRLSLYPEKERSHYPYPERKKNTPSRPSRESPYPLGKREKKKSGDRAGGEGLRIHSSSAPMHGGKQDTPSAGKKWNPRNTFLSGGIRPQKTVASPVP